MPVAQKFIRPSYKPLTTFQRVYALAFTIWYLVRDLFLGLVHRVLPWVVPEFPAYAPDPKHGILITGTSTGIGADAALYFAHQGYTVWAGVRKTEDGHRLVRMFQEQGSMKGKIVPLLLDVALPRAINQAVRTVSADKTSRLVAIINNAGVCPSFPSEMLPSNTLVNLMKVNVLGCINVTNAFLPLLRQTRGSRVIIVGSLCGSVAMPMVSAYCATKSAVEGWAEGLRLELRDFGISVSVVKPGSVMTPIFDKSRTEFEQVTSSASLDLDETSSTTSNLEPHEDLRPVYAKWIQLAPLVSQSLTSRAISPYYCSLALWHAATAKHPATSYYVGWDSVLLSTVRPWIPDLLWDALFLRIVDLNVRLFGATSSKKLQ